MHANVGRASRVGQLGEVARQLVEVRGVGDKVLIGHADANASHVDARDDERGDHDSGADQFARR